MPEAALRTSQAARLLGVSADTLRKLIRLNLIECEQSPGGHARIPLPVIEVLKRDGLPIVPCEIEDAPEELQPEAASPRQSLELRSSDRDDLQQDDPPSDSVTAAEDEVSIEQAHARKDQIAVDRLQTQWQRGEVLKKLRSQEQSDHEFEENKRAQAEARAAAERRRMSKIHWLEYTVGQIPTDADAASRLSIHDLCDEALEKLLQSGLTGSAIQTTLDQIIASVMLPLRRKQEVETLIENACKRLLPSSARRDLEWLNRAVHESTKALNDLRSGASVFEQETAIAYVMSSINARFEYGERRELKIRSAWLSDAASDERDAASASVRRALEALPAGSSDQDLETARDRALEPYRAVIRARKDREMRKTLLPYYVFYYLPAGLDQKKLEKEIQEAIDQQPEGTPRNKLEEIRDGIITSKKAEAKTKEALINDGLSQIAEYIDRLKRKGWIIPEDTAGLARQIRTEIQPQLEQEITSLATAEYVTKVVYRLAREAIGIGI